MQKLLCLIVAIVCFILSSGFPQAAAAIDPGADSTLFLLGGSINSLEITPTERTVQVEPGASISGLVQVEINSAWRSNAVMAMGWTPTWGSNSSSYVSVPAFRGPISGLRRTISLDVTAPEEPGTYWVIFAYRGEFTAGQVFSATNWGVGTLIWNNGDDIAAWSDQMIQIANRDGNVLAPYRVTRGTTELFVPATAIRVIVSGNFIEDWETGRIDSGRWQTYGSPSPTIRKAGFESDFAFDPRGDSFCDSGVQTLQGFELQNRTLSFVGKVGGTFGHFEDSGIGVTKNALRPSPCLEGGLQPLAHIRIRGDENRFWVQYILAGEKFEETIDGDWHSYQIRFLEDGRVAFFRDGQLRHTTTTTIDYSEFNSQKVFVAGRSFSSAPMLIDDIELRPSADRLASRVEPGILECSSTGPAPTVLITHGWQPFGNSGTLPSWVGDMKEAIAERIEGPLNVCSYTWPEAFSLSFSKPQAFIEGQGVKLRQELVDRLGNCGQDCPLHFIGHSYGTILNAHAAHEMTTHDYQVAQFTALDPALNLTPYSEKTFRRLLPSEPRVVWFDNYIAIDLILNTVLDLPVIGESVQGAAEDGGFRVDASHINIHQDFFLPTIRNRSSRAGFYFSAFLGDDGGFEERPAPQLWKPMVPKRVLLFQVAETLGDALGIWSIVDGRVTLIHLGTETVFQLLESSDSAIAVDLEIPADAELLTFDLQTPGPGDGDWLTLRFNDELLYSLRGDMLEAGESLKPEIPVRDLAGESGTLEVRLNGVGERNAEFLFSDLTLWALEDNNPPVADAGPDQGADAGPECTALVTLDASASFDPDEDELKYTWLGPNGETHSGITFQIELPLGSQTWMLEVDDGRGGVDTDEVVITVVDLTPPQVEGFTALPDVLWPPNHRMVEVSLAVQAADNCTMEPVCRAAEIQSSEPAGRGRAESDWKILGDLVVTLRAERSGFKDDRVYTIELLCVDDAGSSTTAETFVTVPHDQRGRGPQ